MRVGLGLWLSPLAMLGCASAPTSPHVPRVVDDLELAPYAVHEECRRLEANDRFDYRFESSNPVNFDLRYRDGNAVVMPIARAESREDAGVYVVPFAHDFCLSWEAGPSGARLSYRFLVHTPPP